MSTKDRLKPYNGELSADEIADGIAAAQANALRLVEDAKLLIVARRFATAAALAILAVEERGKVLVLKRFAIIPAAQLKETWREYRSHRAKNAGWVMPLMISKGARTLNDFAPMVDKNADHTSLLDALKQIAIYTDCLGERHWSRPDEVIDEQLAVLLIEIAERMWGENKVTSREIELWREMVAPHYGTDEMADAVIRCEEELVKSGLRNTPIESLRAFMEGRPIAVDTGNEKRASGRSKD